MSIYAIDPRDTWSEPRNLCAQGSDCIVNEQLGYDDCNEHETHPTNGVCAACLHALMLQGLGDVCRSLDNSTLEWEVLNLCAEILEESEESIVDRFLQSRRLRADKERREEEQRTRERADTRRVVEAFRGVRP